MPLSEREQRLLDQMEQALYAEDPKFATTLRKSSSRPIDGRRMFLAVLLFAAGMAGLLAGVATSFVWFGVAGFLAMLGGVLLGLASLRPAKPVATTRQNTKAAGAAAPRAASGSSFMGKVEERWRRRRDGEGY